MSEEMKNDELENLLKAEEEALQNAEVGDVVQASVVSVDNSRALVHIPGFKSDIPIDKKELAVPEPDAAGDVVSVGDEIDVYIVSLGGEHGATVSKVRADRLVAWKDFDGIVERGEILEAVIVPYTHLTLPTID